MINIGAMAALEVKDGVVLSGDLDSVQTALVVQTSVDSDVDKTRAASLNLHLVKKVFNIMKMCLRRFS